MERVDLASRNDIERMVNLFYDKVKGDALLAPLFAHVNWPEHLPIMYNFWCSMLLGDQSYKGNPFAKHMQLSLRAEHFERWLTLFHQTIEENFEGAVANEARSRATQIASVWHFKLQVT